MNKTEIEKILKVLEDKCINRVDENFNIYLLNDLFDAGGPNELINNVDWYLYYTESAMELYSLINNLLLNAQENKEYLLRSIALKRLIDEKLIFYANGDQQMVESDLGLNHVYSKANESIMLNAIKPNFLKNLFNELSKRKLIENTFYEFESNFMEGEIFYPINWKGKQKELSGLLVSLKDAMFLSYDNNTIHKVLRHFKINQKHVNVTSIITDTYSIFDDYSKYKKEDFDFIKQCNL